MSEKQRPTPGPWEVGDPDVHGRKVYGPVVDDYADPGELAVIAEGMTEPNARLIAAAPEMLEVLRLLDHAVDRQTGHVSIGAVQTAAIAARAVIAKATGGAK